MPCDERYRAWARRQRPAGENLPPPELRRAVLTGAGPCPARAGFRELRFDVGGALWSWCFPGPAGADGGVPPSQIRAVVLRPGPHGLAAEAVLDQQAGHQPAKLSPAAVAELALAEVPVLVHGSLLPRVSV
jgi:hypothetical protein